MKLKNIYLTAIIALAFSALQAQVPNYVPTNGLVGWWPFTGNANDLSGNGNNGTVNGATLTTDRFGSASSAYSFNGTSNYINVTNSNSLNPTSKLSISVWVKTSGGNYNAGVLGKWNNGNNIRQYAITAQNPNSICFDIFPTINPQVDVCQTSSSYSNNQWHNVICVWDSLQAKLYFDGVLAGTAACVGSIGYSPQDFEIGRYAGGQSTQVGVNNNYFNGLIDDIGIWNRALTQQEVTNLYNSTTNTCPLITSVTLNAQQTQSSVTNTTVGYLPNSTKIISDTTQWHYLALTKSGSTGNFYFDGTLVTSSSFASNPYIWNSLLLGATQACVSCSPVADFNGLIDEVRVSNVARTASNIASAYSANSPFTADANTIGLFHLDNISANTVTNTIGGTAATFGTPALASGKFGQAMSFDGVDDYVRWSSSIPVNNMTIEFWVKSSDQSATMAMLKYAYNTGIYLQSSTVTNPILWSTGDTANTITVNPTQLPYVWVSNGSCSDTIFFNSQSATHYDTLTTTVTVYDTVTTSITLYDTVTTTINDTVTTYLSVTDTLIIDIKLTGLNPPNNLNTIKAYPNPASDHLLVDYGNYTAMAGYYLKVTNVLGQVVYNQLITQQITNIDISTWGGAGTYILYVLDAQQAVKNIKEVVLQ